MNISNTRVKTLLAALVVLFITNLVLAFMLFKKPQNAGNKKPEGPLQGFLKNEVQFSQAQMAAYDSLRAQHRLSMHRSFDSIRQQKQQLYNTLAANNFSDSAIRNTIVSAANTQEAVEENMVSSLSQIRALCTPEQRAIFDTGFSKYLFERRAPKKK